AASRELVGMVGECRRGEARVRARADALGRMSFVPELAEQPLEQIDIERGRIEVALERVDVPLLPVLDDVVEQVHRPGDAALEKGEAELRKPPRDAAQEQRAAEELGAVGEIA